MSDIFTTCADDAVMDRMEAVNKARILLTSDDHRSDLTEMAKISNDILALKARYDELQAVIDTRNKVYMDAEEALGAHLMAKHRVVAPQPQTPASDDPEAVLPVKVRPGVDDHHASNCAIFFDEFCDCS